MSDNRVLGFEVEIERENEIYRVYWDGKLVGAGKSTDEALKDAQIGIEKIRPKVVLKYDFNGMKVKIYQNACKPHEFWSRYRGKYIAFDSNIKKLQKVTNSILQKINVDPDELVNDFYGVAQRTVKSNDKWNMKYLMLLLERYLDLCEMRDIEPEYKDVNSVLFRNGELKYIEND